MHKCLYMPYSKMIIISARNAKKEHWIELKKKLKPLGIEVVATGNTKLLKYAYKQCTKKPANSVPDATTPLTVQDIRDALSRMVSAGDWKEDSIVKTARESSFNPSKAEIKEIANYKAVVIDTNAKIDKQGALQAAQILLDRAEEFGKEASFEQESTGEEV